MFEFEKVSTDAIGAGGATPKPTPPLDAAKTAYLRAFCDVYFPQLADLALSQHNDYAINLLIFSARPELQTPKPTEAGVEDYWTAMLELASALSAQE